MTTHSASTPTPSTPSTPASTAPTTSPLTTAHPPLPNTPATADLLRSLHIHHNHSPSTLANHFNLLAPHVHSILSDPDTLSVRLLLDEADADAAARDLVILTHKSVLASIALADNPHATQEQRRRAGTLNSTVRTATRALAQARAQLNPAQSNTTPQRTQPHTQPHTQPKAHPKLPSTKHPTPQPTAQPTPPQNQSPTPTPTNPSTPAPQNQRQPQQKSPHPLRDNRTWQALARTLNPKQLNTALALDPDHLQQLLQSPKHLKQALNALLHQQAAA